jgi:hypothetical protein
MEAVPTPNSSAEDLATQASWLARLCAWVAGITPLEVPATYWPENPGQIRYRADLDRGTAGLALLHEARQSAPTWIVCVTAAPATQRYALPQHVRYFRARCECVILDLLK